MKRITSFLTCALAMTLLAGGARAFADEVVPDPDQIFIRTIAYGGTGCPLGTATVAPSADGQAFTVIYSAFVTSMGPGIPITQNRKNCQLNLTLHIPQGFTYAIASVDYRGFYDLAQGAKGSQKAIYYFQGQAPQASTWRTFVGGRGGSSDDWQLRDEVEAAALVWAPCGIDRALNINADLRLERGSSRSSDSSTMAMDSEDGQITQIYHLRFRECR